MYVCRPSNDTRFRKPPSSVAGRGTLNDGVAVAFRASRLTACSGSVAAASSTIGKYEWSTVPSVFDDVMTLPSTA